jgi:hypothetical protein
MVTKLFQNIHFTYEGHIISNYGEVYALRKLLIKDTISNENNKNVINLNTMVVATVVDLLKISNSPEVGDAFTIITSFKGDRNSDIHGYRDLSEIEEAAEYFCLHSSSIPDERRERWKGCFMMFANAVCTYKEEYTDYGNISSELDLI